MSMAAPTLAADNRISNDTNATLDVTPYLHLLPISSVDSRSEEKSIDEILNPDEETMFEQMKAQMGFEEALLLAEGKIDTSSLGQPVYSTDGVRAVTATSYYYSSFSMPTAQFYVVATGWRDSDFSSATYNGVECLKFSNGTMIVYVSKDAFYPDSNTVYDNRGSNPTSLASTVSTVVTSYMNAGNPNYYYSGKWRAYSDANGAQYVDFVIYGTQMGYFSSNKLVAKHKIITSAGSHAHLYLTGDVEPTIKVEITNTGSGSRYLGAYEIKGVGDSTDTDDISSMLKIGYKTYEIAASTAVSGLTTATAFSIFKETIDFLGSGSTAKPYFSESIFLYNIAKGIYPYSCSLKCPFPMSSNGHYYEVYIGLMGSSGTSLKYKFTLSF